MYEWDFIKKPDVITRESFVEMVFEIGSSYNHGYDSIIASVQLGDQYIDMTNNIYSSELAHVVTLIIGKFNEDHGCTETRLVLTNTNNKYIVQLENEIYSMIGFHVKIYNFITVIEDLLLSYNENFDPSYYHSLFYDISKDICQDKKLLSLNPRAIIIGIIILYKRGLLKSYKINKQRIFLNFIEKISQEYEVDMYAMLHAYIELKLNSK